MAAAIRNTLLIRMPDIPSQGKWTTVGPCLDFVFIGVAVHGALEHICAHAFQKLMSETIVEVAGDESSNWRAVNGVRAKKLKEKLGEEK